MTTLADKAILSGADNRPPMLEKDMYDLWKSRMELYMMNRRPKKYSELSAMEAIQADCDVKATNIILQGLPSEVYALVSNHKVAKELWERIQLLMQGTSLTKQKREFHHNVYNPSSSIPRVKYAPSVLPQSDFSQQDYGLIVPVFQKGDDPIDDINHMMSFLTAFVTSQYPPTNNQLRNSSNPRQQATINNGRVAVQLIQGRQNCLAAGEGHMSKQCTKPKRKRDEAWFKDKTKLSVEQVFWSQNSVNSEELNLSPRPTIVEVPKELPKVSMVNSSLKKLKYHLASFDVVVKERTIVAVEQHRVESNTFQDKMKEVLNKNERILEQAISNDIVNIVVTANVNNAYETELEEIETMNIELDHRVTKLVTENEHLKHNYKKLYDSIKSSRIRSKEQCDDLIKQVNIKSAENSDLNASLQEKVLVITALKDTLRKLKEKTVVDEAVTLHPIDPELLKIDVTPLAPKLRNNRTVHYDYLKHTQEETATLRVNMPTSASGSKPSGNTKKDKIQQTQSSVKKNKLEAYPRNVRTSLHNKKSVVNTKDIASVPNSKLNVNYDLQCATCNGCLFSDNHDSCVLEFINSVNALKFDNDHVAKIMGYGDYKIGNVTISRVYFVERLGHNLFSVGQFCDSDLEVAFRQHTCFIRNLEGVDLLIGSRGNNLYTLSLGDMMVSSPICLLSNASKTKSWLWHRRLFHLNFGAINHLARQGLVRGLFKLKFEKEYLCSACAMGKNFIIKFLKMIQVRLKVPVRRIQTYNGTKFVNQTLHEYYEMVGISHEISVARSPQQNGVVERRNRTIIEAARTMLIYAQALLFLWAEAVATACYIQNRSIVRLRHGKTPYKLLHDKLPDLSFLYVFGALCYPTNDSENLAPEVIAPLAEVIPPEQVESTETQPPIIPHDVEEHNHNIEVTHIVSTRLQLHEQALFCYYDAFLTYVKPKTYKDALTQSCWIKAIQEELNEFERLKVWELVPRPDKVMVIM
nr:hypothetical protein [Tanacetum cinerariifolium]